MAISIDQGTRLITIPQADLSFVSGTLYTLDTNAFRNNVMAILDDESHIWLPDAFSHNTEVAVAGVTYARIIEFINSFSIQFEDTGSAYTVRLEGSNNNIFDVENGILVPTNRVTVISTNSAGLQTVVSGSGVTQQDKDDIENQIFARAVEGVETFEQMMRIMRAAAAGTIVEQTDGSYVIRSRDGLTDRITGDDAANGGRSISATDGT